MSIVFRDQAHLNAYCATPPAPVQTHIQTQTHDWISNMDFTHEAKLVLLVLAIAAAYYLGKEGFGILSKIYSGIRNLFSGTKTQTPAPAPVATQPVSTPVA